MKNISKLIKHLKQTSGLSYRLIHKRGLSATTTMDLISGKRVPLLMRKETVNHITEVFNVDKQTVVDALIEDIKNYYEN